MQSTVDSSLRLAWVSLVIGTCVLTATAPCTGAPPVSYVFTFDHPISWADDVVPWGLGANHSWGIVEGGCPGKALRISDGVAKGGRTFEIRTLQFSHKPDTPVTVSFDVRMASAPVGSFLQVRYFDGYCGGDAFENGFEDRSLGISHPVWDSRTAKQTSDWQRANFSTGLLVNTVLTLAFMVQRPANGATGHIESYLDNLEVETVALDRMMDLDFDWHGVRGGSTGEFRWTTMAANSDWCDFADQDDVLDRYGDTVHYTLLQHRDASSVGHLRHKSELIHETCLERHDGISALVLARYGAGGNSAASWGVRQTVSYEALGLKPHEPATIRVSARLANYDPDKNYIVCSQIGVDSWGGVITQKAQWSKKEGWNLANKGWREPRITFDRPKEGRAFTVYVRMRDGMARPPTEILPFPEPASMGSPSLCETYVDWVKVEVCTARVVRTARKP